MGHSSDRILTPQAVKQMIAEGHAIVIFEDVVLRLDSWLTRHPGGRLAILHMVGKDATDEMTVYHSAATMKTMRAFMIGRKPPGPWTNLTPPIRGGVYHREKEMAVEAETACDGAGEKAFLVSEHSTEGEDTAQLNMPCVSKVRSRTSAHEKSPSRDPVPKEAVDVQQSPSDYTDWAVQQEINRDLQDYPSLDPTVQLSIAHKYRLLHQKIRDQGLYDCPISEYGKELARYVSLFTASMVALYHGWYMTSAAFLGLFWHQIMFTAHDAGHLAITHIFVIDTLIGLFIADFCCGLSLGWWKSSHNVHHLITNHPEHDPDIQNVPLFATCPSFFRSICSTYYDNFVFVWDAAAAFLVPYQQYTYYPIMGVARFNLYLLSWLHVLSDTADLAYPHCLRTRITYRHNASARPDHAVSLGDVYLGARRDGIVRAAPAAHHDGRGLSGMARFHPRRPAVPGSPPSVPAGPAAQPPQGPGASERVLPRRGHSLHDPRVCRWESQGARALGGSQRAA
ncbi:hypothetical protein O1611_g3162 [Lasiodiplodia mahajangana]|uniref:Uncharacterized protein n=1 Tax=Lasiodiplodia mahajangana TaxID=1108764 RepID=A0ACC2JSR5_9PEZI|nr:hypothetical protein O1611_g3162 [Lasiodiplodia mahajangana]